MPTINIEKHFLVYFSTTLTNDHAIVIEPFNTNEDFNENK